MRIFIAILLIVIAVGCRDNRIDSRYGWGKVDSAADSMLVVIDSAWIAGEPNFIIKHRIEIFDTLTRREGMPGQARGRYFYWRAKIASVTEEPEDRLCYYDSLARSYMDSASHPYDHARLNIIKHSLYSKDFVRRYSLLLAALWYAENIGDRYLEAEAMMTLAEYSWLYTNQEQAVSLLKRASSLFRNIGLDHRANVADLNIRLVEGDSADVMRGLEKMMGNSLRPEDPHEPTINEIMYYGMRNDAEALKTLQKLPATSLEMQAIIAGSIYNIYNETGNKKCLDSLVAVNMPMMRKVVEQGRNRGDRRLFILAYNFALANTDRYDRARCSDSAFSALQEAMQIENEYREYFGIAQSRDVTKSWMETALRRQEELNTRDRTVNALWWSLAVGLLLIVGVCVWTLMSRKVQHEKVKKTQAELESEKYKASLERGQRELVSSTLAITEKDKVLQSILDDVEKMEREGRLETEEARKIDSNIRIHLSSKQEWEQFKTAFDKVSPMFMRNLRETYPELTEGDIRMAVYVKLGLNSKQIARLLMITPGSVKLKRHRLREHMGLSPEASLEDTLRRID